MTELMQALAIEGDVEYDGKKYRLGGTTLEVMARWEDWLASETLERLSRLMAKRPGGDQQAIRTVADQSADGVFDFFGETSRKRMAELSGLKQLMFFRIAQNHPDVTKATIDSIVDRDYEKFIRELEKEAAAQGIILPNDDAPTTGASPKESSGAQ